MRKSLGSKRREIPTEACDEITRMYAGMLNGDAGWGEYSKIFATTDFGYREIRVERPLKLAFEVTEDGLETLRQAKPFQKLDEGEATAIIAALTTHLPQGQRWMDRAKFLPAFDTAIRKAGVKLGAPMRKTILSAISEADEEAAICRDKAGKPEPDTSLRDHELVPRIRTGKTTSPVRCCRLSLCLGGQNAHRCH